MYFHFIVFAYNTSAHSSTNLTPQFLTISFETRHPSELILCASSFDLHSIVHNVNTSALLGPSAFDAHALFKSFALMYDRFAYVSSNHLSFYQREQE